MEQIANVTQRTAQVPRLDVVGKSRAAGEMRRFAEAVATSDFTVFLRGETGVGKDHLAQVIHETGRRSAQFVHVDCGAINESLSDTELFGHTRGAFTDAREESPGLLALADEGTVFFNEVGNMGKWLQAKFLSVLDRKPFRRVGGSKWIPFTARVIAATNIDLAEEVEAGRFREDLFHRLNEIVFVIPPLRDRREDILPLAEYFSPAPETSEDPPLKLSPEAARLLERGYDWPGNVRELEKAMRRAYVFRPEDGVLAPEHFQPHFGKFARKRNFPTFEEVQREYLREVLARHMGKQKDAAEEAGISPRVMNYQIKVFGLQDYVASLRRVQ